MYHQPILNLLKPNIRFTMYWLPALIAGGASILGGILANKSQKEQASTANQLTMEQFDKGLAFNAAEAATIIIEFEVLSDSTKKE